MSPELCIQPCGLVVAEFALELVADVVLAERADRESNRVAGGGVELGRTALQFLAALCPAVRCHVVEFSSVKTAMNSA